MRSLPGAAWGRNDLRLPLGRGRPESAHEFVKRGLGLLTERPPLVDGAPQALQLLERRPIVERNAPGIAALHQSSGPVVPHLVKLKRTGAYDSILISSTSNTSIPFGAPARPP